ncbi:MAG: hypothetical protein K0U37_07510 [Gammaproteobacteria bacterium]|nr:hypothetical protein [Gammaproteobacteria bacterium]
MKKTLLTTMLLGSMNVTAGTMESPPSQALPWHFYATLGYVSYKDMVDKNVAVERIAASRDIFDYHDAAFGIELGVQTGLSSRLLTSQEKLDAMGGPAIQAVIATFLDVLGTASVPLSVLPAVRNHMTQVPHSGLIVDFVEHTELFAKVGMAYRQMHFDRNSINPKVKISPEVQVGFSKALSSHASIALAYQGIYASGVGLTVNGTNPRLSTGAVKSIPTQNGALLILGWNAA